MRVTAPALSLLLGLAIASTAHAQSSPAARAPAGAADTVRLTLAAALAEARSASEQVGIAKADVSRSKGVVTQTRAALLPQVNLGPQYTRVLASPYENLFSGGTGNVENPFTSSNQWRLGGSVGLSLFNLSQWSQLGASEAASRVSQLQLTQQQALTILTVASAYYDASLSAQLLAITEFTLAQAEKTLADVTLAREVGSQSEFEQLRARVSRDNQIPVVTRARANRDIALTRLKQLLDIPLAAELVLATPLDDSPDIGDLPADVAAMITSADTTVVARAVVQAAAETVVQSEQLKSAASRQWIPTMSTTMNYNRAGYSSDFFPVNSQFGNDWTINAVVNWPLFTSGRISGARQQAAANLEAARLRAKLTAEQAALDNETVNARLREARDNSLATASVVEQATRAYEIAELRYAEGVSTQTELQDVRLQLEQARANQAQAARDMQVARFRRALLPYLPLGTADGAALTTSSVTSAGAAAQALAGASTTAGR
ncbi:MAG TPA: TolC family protein [Gemmatimonadales bacterium]|nr:TolC family protein [Gemmatimonadales bacterium]